MDDELDTLTVIEVNDPDLYWKDLYINGSCSWVIIGNEVSVEDKLTDCKGVISIININTGSVLGTWQFSE